MNIEIGSDEAVADLAPTESHNNPDAEMAVAQMKKFMREAPAKGINIQTLIREGLNLEKAVTHERAPHPAFGHLLPASGAKGEDSPRPVLFPTLSARGESAKAPLARLRERGGGEGGAQ